MFLMECAAFACLASRFPYGQEITREKLNMIDQAEQFLLVHRFRQIRLHCRSDIARIEVPSGDRASARPWACAERLCRVQEDRALVCIARPTGVSNG